MSTPLSAFPHQDHPRTPQAGQSASSFLQEHLTLSQATTFDLAHYAILWLKAGRLSAQAGFQRWTLTANQFLVINPNQTLRLSPAADEPVEIVLTKISKALFQDQLTRLTELETFATLRNHTEGSGHLELCERIYEAQENELGTQLIQQSRQAYQAVPGTAKDFSEPARDITEALLSLQNTAYQQMLNLTSAKLSTKRELYRRLCIARTHMHGHLDEALDLDTLAQVACLSKYHFIRLFKEAFGQTPRQYLITLRLDQARTLLIHTDKTFHEICHEVGLKDSSSFGRLFKRSFGATPHLYRQQYA